ncbi:MAG: DMT family transporter [Candidatus Magasanikbacteria bacterium]|nr:DMT family transporter [Candidatus Magasanikbacteria bacterium]
MSWFLIALLASLCWSLTVHTDKFVLSRYFKSNGPGGYILFTSVVELVIVAAIFLTHHNALSVPPHEIFFLLTSGAAYIIGLLFYVWAITKEEATRVSIVFQTIPVFTFIIEYFFLHAFFTKFQLIGSVIILAGAILISIDTDNITRKKVRLRRSALLLMLASSMLIAISWILFRQGALANDYWTSIAWQYTGCVFVGAILFFGVGPYRRSFFSVLKNNGIGVILLNVANELLNEGGNRLMSYAVLFVPVTLAQVTNSFQAVFVFLLGVVLTIFFPKISKESISAKDIIQKISAIIVMILGAWILGW